MSVYNKLTEQGLLVHSHSPALPWEINLVEFERLLLDRIPDAHDVQITRAEGEV